MERDIMLALREDLKELFPLDQEIRFYQPSVQSLDSSGNIVKTKASGALLQAYLRYRDFLLRTKIAFQLVHANRSSTNKDKGKN